MNIPAGPYIGTSLHESNFQHQHQQMILSCSLALKETVSLSIRRTTLFKSAKLLRARQTIFVRSSSLAMASSGPFPVTAHPYDSPTRHSCAYEIGPKSAHNAIIFIGGLGDGPHTVPYIRHLAKHLEDSSDLSYSVFEIRMTSSFIGFGMSSLTKDVADITALVKYLRGIGKERIVLFGHSTGCQVREHHARLV